MQKCAAVFRFLSEVIRNAQILYVIKIYVSFTNVFIEVEQL